jgi:hypothetical protein
MSFFAELGFRVGRLLRGDVRTALRGRTRIFAPTPAARVVTAQERNEIIIQAHLKKLRPGYTERYHIENCVRDCI